MLKAKFHYASCFGAGSKLVRSRSATGFEPDSVMEFGFNITFDLSLFSEVVTGAEIGITLTLVEF